MPPASHAAQKRAAAQAARAAAKDKEQSQSAVKDDAPSVIDTSKPAEDDDAPPAADEPPLVLAEEVVPAGKHQGNTFQQVLDDVPFCKWVCKEPRRGWMGLFKLFLETEHGYEASTEADEQPEQDEEEAAQAAAVAAARAKLLAKGKGKGAPKKAAAPAYSADKPPAAPVHRIPFEPTKEWQEVLPEHLCGRGLQFTMNVKTGKSYARLMP
eukprot:TRINITY_DN8139_c0_g1_i2.p1 TRINITY_DN8139_c0_g1~~TRINITY_DN8139_c0_g1_i2.p1  ORF type:complete len:211 (+),score=74.44 TRINITY_DN8139_c0_g1_i2:304-936(+)